MPTYSYKCENGHDYEETRGMTEKPRRSICAEEGCDGRLIRVFGAPSITFNGTGFNSKHG